MKKNTIYLLKLSDKGNQRHKLPLPLLSLLIEKPPLDSLQCNFLYVSGYFEALL